MYLMYAQLRSLQANLNQAWTVGCTAQTVLYVKSVFESCSGHPFTCM